MSAILITYDLCQPGRDYTALYKQLENYGAARALESVWFMPAGGAHPEDIHTRLAGVMDSNDKLFVGTVTGPAVWHNISAPMSAWMQKNL